jgi:hypothetical protein
VTTYGEYGEEAEGNDGGRGRLVAAWLLFVALLLGVTAWLFAEADNTRLHSTVPVVRLAVPDQIGQTTHADGTSTMADASVPAPAAPAPAPTPVVLPPTTTGKLIPKPPKDSGPDAPPAPRAAPRGEGVAITPLQAPTAPTPVAQAPIPAPSPVAASPSAAPQIAAATVPDSGDHQPLPHGPNQALLASATYGQLPIIGSDGTAPWKYYAKPFAESDRRPRIAVIVTGLGLNAALTQIAINHLPGNVTLAFDPYTDRLNDWMAQARAQGHEVLIGVPMEPNDYPDSDPGPATLLTSLSASDNKQRLEWTLARASGYVAWLARRALSSLPRPRTCCPCSTS